MAARRRRSETSLSHVVRRRLRERRISLGLNQEDVAHLIGISREAYSKLERGIHLPSAETLVKLARELDVTTDALLGIAGPTMRTGERPAQYRTLSPEALKLLRRLSKSNKTSDRIITTLTKLALGGGRSD
jgi:transcriptional regulator with XRE-family HTH domain